MTVRILLLTRYGRLGASSRLRFFQYEQLLTKANITLEIQPLFDDDALSKRYIKGSYGWFALLSTYLKRFHVLLKRKYFDLLWIEKEALPWLPFWIEALLLHDRSYTLDFDDAIFHNYDQNRFVFIRKIYGKRIDKLMANASLVIAGSGYLAQRALAAGCHNVEIIPTVIDLNRYDVTSTLKLSNSDGIMRIVWIGSPSTVVYLDLLREPLKILSQKTPFKLRIIGASVEMDGVDAECFDWNESTEVEHIAVSDIGVMPLFNSPWEQGKCGYKLIQYMACGLPVVASNVGANSEIIDEGNNGFLVDSSEEWIKSLEKLLTQPKLRSELGGYGRELVEERYCLQVTAPRVVRLLSQAAGMV